jgi:hypothetical protein
VKLSLKQRYCSKTLLLAGLESSSLCEHYKFIDLGTGELREWKVDNAPIREGQAAVLREHLGASSVPYGFDDSRALIPYFLHPHSFVHGRDGRVYVFFKQAPYFRVLDLAANAAFVAPNSEIDYRSAFSSTNCEASDGMYMARTNTSQRLDRYRGSSAKVACELVRYQPEANACEPLATVNDFMIDSIHQVALSKAQFLVALDMNLSVDVPASSPSICNLDVASEVSRYAAYDFPRSDFFVHDLRSGATRVVQTSAPCAAHVEFSLRDPGVFYVTCHNISKWQNNVVVHGPATLEKYMYRAGSVTRLGAFSDDAFFRTTSHRVIRRGERELIAVTVYPNKLYLLDAETMTLDASVELFESAPRSAPFVCEKNSVAPLYIAQSEDGEHLFLTGNSLLFVVSLRDRCVVDTIEFCAPGSFLATAHIGTLARVGT